MQLVEAELQMNRVGPIPAEETMNESLDHLKNAILTLKAAGPGGFEGFVRIILTALTDVPFRLAASGLQGGVDGDAAFYGDAVSFEAKRYSGDIPRNEILTKVADLARTSHAPDRLWVLGATTEVSSQLASAVREVGDQRAISTLILDWTASPLPLLGVSAVAAGQLAIDFLCEHGEPKHERAALDRAFYDLGNHPDFNDLVHRIKTNLSVPTLAVNRAVAGNRRWRKASFGSESIARAKFGQALAVSSVPELHSLRASLRDEVRAGILAGEDVILTGEEGHGKSWLAAQICSSFEGLALFLSAEQLERSGARSFNECLVEFFIDQTGDISDEGTRLRWSHRLNAWQRQSPHSPFLVIVDGINQRSHLRWDRILNSMQAELGALGGRLVVTVRPQFWHRDVLPGLAFPHKQIRIPEWLPDERNQVLEQCGVRLEWLDEATLRTLRNPRLLGVAIAVIPHCDSDAWKGLTTDRILMEHLRASQRENFEDEPMHELTKRLSNHAKKVFEQARESKKFLENFEEDSTAVIETRFFKTLPGPGTSYVLRDEGLTLALGYALIDQLWQARHRNFDLCEHIAHLIDPIYAMDRTVDVVFAALMVCALDPIRFDRYIFGALLEAFSELQNVNEKRFEEFVSIVRKQPAELMETLGSIVLAGTRRLNQDWLRQAALEMASSREAWPAVEVFIHRWLRVYNKDAVIQIGRYPKVSEDEDKKEIQDRKQEIQDILSSLSSFEDDLLSQMSEVVGDTDALYTLALSFLAGRPLAGFATSFVALGLGFALEKSVWSARKAFQQLTTFNRIDRETAGNAFRWAVEPLRSSQTSRAGRWTVVRMLYAAGDEASAFEASEIAHELRQEWSYSKGPRADEWRQTRAADPHAARPVDMEAGLRNFDAISPANIKQFMGQTSEDYDLDEFLPIACRFEPEASIAKIRQILETLLIRTQLPLRQLILNGREYSPLMTRSLSLQILARAADPEFFASIVEREKDALQMYLFSYIVPHLTAAEQLDCMVSPRFGTDFLADILPCLKQQPQEAISNALHCAIGTGDETIAYGALVAAYYGGTSINSHFESLISKFQNAESRSLRSVSFQLALQYNLGTFRSAHVRNGWCSAKVDPRSFENWYGSLLVVEACSKGEITVHEMVKRTSPRTWFIAARRIGNESADLFVDHFWRRLQKGIAATADMPMPAVDITLTTAERSLCPIFSISAADRQKVRIRREPTADEVFNTDEGNDFYEKQDRIRVAFDSFLGTLQAADTWILVERITMEDLKFLVGYRPSLSIKIFELMERASRAELGWARNVAFAAANLVSKDMPERAVALFEKLSETHGFVTLALGDDLTLEHEAIWTSAPSPTMERLWWRRLVYAENDEVLAREVLAAERFGASAFIRTLVEENAASRSTLDQALAIAVAGFSRQSEPFAELIDAHLDNKGISGDAAKMAKAAVEAAKWADRWVADMWAADTPEEFWRCLMISRTCMDARACTEPSEHSKWSCYRAVFRKMRGKALEEQTKKRKKTLFGQEVPDKIFIAKASATT